jgi:hypothetical protein
MDASKKDSPKTTLSRDTTINIREFLKRTAPIAVIVILIIGGIIVYHRNAQSPATIYSKNKKSVVLIESFAQA